MNEVVEVVQNENRVVDNDADEHDATHDSEYGNRVAGEVKSPEHADQCWWQSGEDQGRLHE